MSLPVSTLPIHVPSAKDGCGETAGHTNKQTVIAFYEMMFNHCRPAEAIATFAGDIYIQHNAHVADGKQGFIDYFERMAVEHPGKHVTVKRAFCDGNHVILHCHQVWPGGIEYAGIDIFRLDAAG